MEILELKLFTPRLADQTVFYTDVLGLEAVFHTKDRVAFKVGKSILIFENREISNPYHFAINIPSNKELEALAWLKSKVEILKDGDIEIHDFESWNSRAIYFYDEDQNIVEFISRKNLNHNSDQKFDANLFLEISEIGIPVNCIEDVFNILHDKTGIELYDGGFERFCALGDEKGLFICLDKNKKNWFPSNDKVYSADYKLRFKENDIEYQMEFNNGNIIFDPNITVSSL